jgi:hypothetical protein
MQSTLRRSTPFNEKRFKLCTQTNQWFLCTFVTTMFPAARIQNVPFNHTRSFQPTCFNCATNHTSILHSKFTYKGEAVYISTFTSNGPSNLICAWSWRLIVKFQFQKSDFGFRTKTSAISWIVLRQDLSPFIFLSHDRDPFQ